MQKRRSGGDLRYSISINTITRGRDSYGDTTETESLFASPKAEIVTLSANQGGADAEQGESRYRIKIRYRAGVTLAHSITWGGRTLEITGVDETAKHDGWLMIYAKEVTP